MTPRTLRRILFPVAALVIAAFAWWWDQRDVKPAIPHDRDPVVPMPGPHEPNPMRIMPAPPRPPPAPPPKTADVTTPPR